jgi:hypothetical protein
MNTQSLFGSVAIGKDTSGNFKQSVYGLAVRSGPQGRFIARRDGELVDVTDLTFDGTENLVYRFPKKNPTPKQDIIIRSDIPFSVLFVEEVSDGGTVKGIDPATGEIQEYRPVTNLLNTHFFVAPVGPENLISGDEDNDGKELLPLLLLLGNQGTGAITADPLTTILLLRSLGSKEIDSKMLMMLLLLRGGAAGGGNQGTGAITADPLTTILLLRSLGSKEIDSKMLMLLLLLRGGAAGGSNDPFALLLALQGGDLFGEKKQSKSSQDKEHAPHANDKHAEGSKQR